MRTTLDRITFNPEQFWCLHVANHDQSETLFREISQRFKSETVNGIVAGPANLAAVRRGFLRHPTVIEWLTQNADISPDDAAQIIEGFPIPVAPRLSHNAMNPMRFLGLAAAIAGNPDVIVYSTSGMDPRGVSLIHEYAPAHYPDGCLIHVSAYPMGDVPACPNGAKCEIIQFIPHTSDA